MSKRKELCGKPMPLAKNGNSRGFCTRPKSHRGRHGSGTCQGCGSSLAHGSGLCRKCSTIYSRNWGGYAPRNHQHPNTHHKFPCGCEGILPEKGRVNKFAYRVSHASACRVLSILGHTRHAADQHGYKPIDAATPHSVIRALMDEPLCERCRGPLDWTNLGAGKTPHLHHNHETGEIYGFTHSRCNSRAMEDTIDKLRRELEALQKVSRAQPEGRLDCNESAVNL
jgi:hypothetical protein